MIAALVLVPTEQPNLNDVHSWFHHNVDLSCSA